MTTTENFNHATDVCQFGSKAGQRIGRAYLKEALTDRVGRCVQWHEFCFGNPVRAKEAAARANELPFEQAFLYLRNIANADR